MIRLLNHASDAAVVYKDALRGARHIIKKNKNNNNKTPILTLKVYY